jgi:hypothetical protein
VCCRPLQRALYAVKLSPFPETSTLDFMPGYYECKSCGDRTQDDYYLSCTRQCPVCGELKLIGNLEGLTDPGSVPYKEWRITWEVSHYGRPRNTTPPPEWKPRIHSLNIRSRTQG